MRMLIISTVVLVTAILFVDVILWFVSVSAPLYVLAICSLLMSSYLVGSNIVEIVYLWKRKKEDRRFKRFYWYSRMGLIESACLVEPKLAKEYGAGF